MPPGDRVEDSEVTAAGLLPGEKVPPSPMEMDPNVPAPLARPP